MFDLNVKEPEVVHCYNKRIAPNYLLTNYWGDYYCGVCLEQAENVRKVLTSIDVRRLHELIDNLPDTFNVEFTYIDTYKPREVSWPLIRKHTKGLTQKEAEWIFRYARSSEANCKVRLMIMRRVWKKGEVLGKEEHVERLKHQVIGGGYRNYLERWFPTIKQRIGRFNKYFPSRCGKGARTHIQNWLNLYAYQYNKIRIHRTLKMPPAKWEALS